MIKITTKAIQNSVKLVSIV